MRISDWSSDVCSSDLEQVQAGLRLHPLPHCCLVQAAIGLTPRGPHRRALARVERAPLADRKSVVSGKRVSGRVDLGGRRIITKKTLPKHESTNNTITTTH